MALDHADVPAAAPAAEPRAVPRVSVGRRLIDLGEVYGLIALTAVVIAFFSLLPASGDTFFTTANLRIVLADQAVLLVVALAILIPMVVNVWNFTPGAVAGLTSIYAASIGASTGSFLLAVVAALAIGIAIGIVIAVLVTVLKINSVIATFGMTIIIAGIIDLKTGGNSIVGGLPSEFRAVGRGDVLGIPSLIVVALVVALLVLYLLRMTPFGRDLYAVGSNRAAARLVGLRVEWLTALTFVASGALSGIAGLLLLSRTGAANPLVGPGFTIPAFAAVFLGAVAIRPGQWNVGGMIAAICFLGALSSGLTLAGAAISVSALANGVALLVGVAFANVFARQRGRQLETS